MHCLYFPVLPTLVCLFGSEMYPSGQTNCGTGICPSEFPVASPSEGHCPLRLQHRLRRSAGHHFCWLRGHPWRPPVDPLHCPPPKRENAGGSPYRDAHDFYHILWLWLSQSPRKWMGPGKSNVPGHKGRIWRRFVDTQYCVCHSEFIINSCGPSVSATEHV